MTTLFARGGSLAALAAALALALPATAAAAQEVPFQPDESDPPGIRVERPSSGTEFGGGPARAEIARPAAPPPSYARADADTPAPRFERVAAEQRQPRPRGEGRAERGAPGGFGGDVIARARAAQQAERRGPDRAERVDRRSEQRADRVDWRSEQRANRVDRRSEQRADRIEQRGDVRADRLEWRGRDNAADRVDRRTENRADRVERRGDFRADRIEQRGDNRAGRIEQRGDNRAERVDGRRGNWRDGRGGGFDGQVRDVARDARRADQWRDGRRDDWRDGRRDDWRDGRRDGWRDGRRDDWRDSRRNWRRDDWRWGWNGRPGWDNRDFRRWNRGWRGNRSYDWFDYRRGNQFLFRPGPYFAPFRSHRYSRVDIGFFLDSLFFQPRFFINDPWAYRLPPAYGPYQWVRYYDDVLLVDIYTGEVVDAIHGFFW